MGYLRERVAYLRGLAEGMQLNETSNEGKLIKQILEVLDDFALSIEDIEEVQEQLSEQIEEIDEDLSAVEDYIMDYDEYDYEDDDVIFKEITCPHCNEQFDLDIDLIDDGHTVLECPNCHKDIEIEWDDACECCGRELDEDEEQELIEE